MQVRAGVSVFPVKLWEELGHEVSGVGLGWVRFGWVGFGLQMWVRAQRGAPGFASGGCGLGKKISGGYGCHFSGVEVGFGPWGQGQGLVRGCWVTGFG